MLDDFLEDESLFGEFLRTPVSEGGVEPSDPRVRQVRGPGLVGPRLARFESSARVRARMPRSRMMPPMRLLDAVTPLLSRAAARCLREGIGEATTYLLPEFPAEHRRRIRTNDMIERLNREIRRRTRVAGGFPDGNSALMLVCACIRYAAANEWSNRRYLDMPRLGGTPEEAN